MTTAPPLTPEAAIEQPAHLIAGELVREGPLFEVVDPCTEEAFASCPAATPALVDAALEAAAAALLAWGRDEGPAARVPGRAGRPDGRSRRPAGPRALSGDGKPFRNAGFEIKGAEMHVRHCAAAEIPVDVIDDDATQRVTLERVPVGVAAAITRGTDRS